MKAKMAFALLLTISITTTLLPMTAMAEQTQTDVVEQQGEQIAQQQEQTEQQQEQTGQQQKQTEQQQEQTEQQQEQTEQTQQKEEQKRTVTVTFDENGAEGTAPESIIISNEKGYLLEQNNMTKQDCFFLGWGIEKESTDVLFLSEEEITVQKLPEDVTESITLYAIWQQAQQCQILYDLGNSEIVREYTYTGKTPQNIPTENKQAKQIIAWKNAENEIVEIASQIVSGNVAYTAVYDMSTMPQQPSQNIEGAIALETEKHIKYMDGSNGNFYPEKVLTRAEACQILYILLKQKQSPQKTFSDIDTQQWYADAVGTLATMGLVEGYGENFEPNREMTRAEFLAILSKIYPSDGTILTFTDVTSEHWAIDAISNAAKRGWISTTENVLPDNAIKRQEAVVILNRVLGRTGDKNTIENTDTRIREFFDVSPSHWAYYDILEATVVHDYQKTDSGENWTDFQKESLNIPCGLYSQNGTLYYIEENGDLARNKTIGNFTFNENGVYTTNHAELDKKLSEIVMLHTSEDMAQEQKLRVLYDYVRDDYKYIKRPFVQKGQLDWEAEYAEAMIDMHKGNCYSFAALYYYLAKQIGYDAHAVIGTIGHNHSPHGWVEIEMNGTTYLFDTEMDMAYRLRGQQYDLYKKTYNDAPFVYVKW
ncbi:S-layer homology domain-containing protein [Clostridium sp. MD294]|uniref:S-layer homology domain-containing protein n=1 Tax=Clostridium sp. MD294 TaxID=97138 RepID=UPI0002CA03AA|nr:S-layer homology domain-containing protein [Clostridium sp. MD294]NDO46185.1 hypothetical protein [Clostridium sp. MD294]USF30148.1 hypothetical protein C820_001589 [Clostridium sp. MD294]